MCIEYRDQSMHHQKVEAGRQARQLDAGVAQPEPTPGAATAEDLVRDALAKGSFHLLLDAALDHGLPLVRQQWALMLADDGVTIPQRIRAEVERMLANIERGIGQAAVERSAASESPRLS